MRNECVFQAGNRTWPLCSDRSGMKPICGAFLGLGEFLHAVRDQCSLQARGLIFVSVGGVFLLFRFSLCLVCVVLSFSLL
uniref:Uncharacterized protein n=1 Tax=Arundo donax TaxID=35708 RepID=A0A0A8Y7L2_ARUDO